MNWLCKFGFHKWGKWINGPWMKFTDTGDSYFWSLRTCEKCGKEVRKVNYSK